MQPEPKMRFNKDGFTYFAAETYLYWQISKKRGEEIMHKYRNLEVLRDAGVHLKFTLDMREFGLDKIRPMKLKIEAGQNDKWCPCDREEKVGVMPTQFLGRNEVVNEEFGWILPQA
jgi:hypothetical protein